MKLLKLSSPMLDEYADMLTDSIGTILFVASFDVERSRACIGFKLQAHLALEVHRLFSQIVPSYACCLLFACVSISCTSCSF